MEDRVKKVEDGLSELKTEIRLMTHTLEAINKTLIEFKAINQSVTQLQIDQSNLVKDFENIDKKLNILFKKMDKVEKRLQDVETTDALQNSKMNSTTAVFWAIGSAILTAVASYFAVPK